MTAVLGDRRPGPTALVAAGTPTVQVLPAGSRPHPRTDLLLTTSGSTGNPAAVQLPADALAAAAAGLRGWLQTRGQTRPLRWVASLPLTGIGGLMCVVRSLLDGGYPWPAPWLGGAQPFTASGFAALAGELRPSSAWAVSLVPTMLARLLGDPLGRAALDRFDLVLVGGAALPDGLREACAAWGSRVVGSYGMTETAGGVVFDGQPVPNVEVDVAGQGHDPTPDPAHDAGQTDGQRIGRLVITGPMVGLGYLDGRLASDWAVDPLADQRSFRTRDLGVIHPGGTVSVLGRVDDVVTVGGVNVDLAAVGRVLAGHPDVADAAVVSVPDPQWGARLVAYLVVRHSVGPDQLDLDALASQVRTRLGRPAVPASFRIVPELPRLPGGKVDRIALGRLAAG